MLEHPQYTKPREYRGLTVPEVLLNGHHQDIAQWQAEQSLLRTRERRGEWMTHEWSELDGRANGPVPLRHLPQPQPTGFLLHMRRSRWPA